MERDERIELLVKECLHWAEEQAGPIPYDRICAEHPDLAEDVERAVRIAALLPAADRATLAGGPAPGDLIANRYRVDRHLGEGAMGVVLLVTDLDLGRSAALKLMRPNVLASSAALRRFEREATALAAVSHPSVVVIYDRGVSDQGLPFLVMEHVDGVSCADIVARAKELGRLDGGTAWLLEEFGIQGLQEETFVRQVVRWTIQVAQGLEAAHQSGIVHRDIKPSNVLVRRDGRAVLIDFGIASSDSGERLTRTGGVVGTPAYMAPEALSPDVPLDARSDVYGLTATLYHLITGDPPYTGNVQEVLASLATREPRRADLVRTGISADARAILEHGLARNPRGRYPGITALERDLQAFLQHKPLSVRPTTAWQRALRRARRSRLVQGAALALALVGLLTGATTWRDHRAAAGAALWAEAFPAVPVNLGLTSHERILDPDARAEIAATLDRLVASGHDPLVAHTLRGLFRMDQGDLAAGRADLREAAEVADTTFARQITELLAESGASPAGTDLTGLPAPRTDDDVYLGLVLGHRARSKTLPSTLADDPRSDRHRHGAEVALLLGGERNRAQVRASEFSAGSAAAQTLEERARALMIEDGYRGAVAGHMVALAHRNRGRYAEALAEWQRVLADAPWSQPALQNVADCLFYLDQVEDALALCDRADRLTGATPGTLVLRAYCNAAEGRRDAAVSALEALPAPRTDRERAWFFDARLRVDAMCAMASRASAPDEVRRIATEAVARCTDPANDGLAKDRSLARLRALAAGDDSELFRILCEEATENPGSILSLREAVSMLPDPLTSVDAQAIVPLLRALPTSLAELPGFGFER